jgi:hypothetical protein
MMKNEITKKKKQITKNEITKKKNQITKKKRKFNKKYYKDILKSDIVDINHFNLAFYFVKKYNIKFKLLPELYSKLKSIKISEYEEYSKKTSEIIEEDHLYLKSYINRDLYNYGVEQLKYKTVYLRGNRQITFYNSIKELDDSYIKKVDVILNMYDSILQKEKYYSIDIFLIKKDKHIEDKSVNRHNLNSGSVKIKKYVLSVFREEEWEKVIIHELIHYTYIHIFNIKKKLQYVFKDIKIQGFETNPNEAYTEFFTNILVCVYNYYYKNVEISLKKYIETRLTIELGWHFTQIVKILSVKGMNNYNELFTKTFEQDSNILSYFLLKTYFLYTIKYQKCIKFSTKHNPLCFNGIDLKDTEFIQILNNLFKEINKINQYSSLRMTCLN